MKRSIISLPAIAASIAFCFILMSTSCKKSSSGGSSGSLTGSFSGSAFQASFVQGLDQSSLLEVEGIQVKAGDSTAVLIDLSDNSPLNTALDFTESDIFYLDAKKTIDFDSEIAPSHGKITITSWDKIVLKIGGTYSGVLYDNNNDSVIITNGTFNTAYKKQ